MDSYFLPPIAVVAVVCMVAGMDALWSSRIHNAITLPFMACGIAYHFAIDGVAGLCLSLTAACLGAVILGIPYVAGMTLPGDIKLIAGAGAWLGMPPTFHLYVVSLLVAGSYAAILLVRRRGYRRVLVSYQILLYQLLAVGRYIGLAHHYEAVPHSNSAKDRPLPLGAVLAVAVLIVSVFCYR